MCHARLVAAFVVLCASLLAIGCAARRPPTDIGAASLDYLHRLLEEKQFCEAYVCYAKLRPELGTMDEGAAGHEYQRLVASTAATGEASWNRILESPSIPLEYKLDLVREIDEAARRAEP